MRRPATGSIRSRWRSSLRPPGRRTWPRQRLGGRVSPGRVAAAAARHRRRTRARLRFDRIPQPWLRELAKRWVRWRLSTGIAARAGRAVASWRSPASPASWPPRPSAPSRSRGSTGRCWSATWPISHAGRGRAHRPTAHSSACSTRSSTRSASTAGTRPCPASAIFFPEDFPKRRQAAAPGPGRARHGPGRAARQPRPLAQPRPAALLTLILMRCGLRVSDALQPAVRLHRPRRRRRPLPALPQPQDETRGPGPHRRGSRGARSPTSSSASSTAGPTAARCCSRRPTDEPDGTKPLIDAHLPRTAAPSGWSAATSATSTADRVHLTPHQWRHTFGTRLINRDVPQEVVRVLLDHDSAQDDRPLRPAARHHRPPPLGEGPQGQHQGRERHPRPGRAARRGRLGQAAARPRHPGPAQRLLRPAGAEDLPARQRLPDLPDVRHHPRVPATAPRAAPAAPADRLRRRGPRPAPRRRDEPAGPGQPRPDHHRPGGRRTTDSTEAPPMRADNTRHIVAAPAAATSTPEPRPSRPCANSTPREPPSPSTPSPATAGVSRSWLYTQPDLRAEIERLRTAHRRAPARPRSRHGSEPPTPRSCDGWRPPTNATADSPRRTASSANNSPEPSATCAPPGTSEHRADSPASALHDSSAKINP